MKNTSVGKQSNVLISLIDDPSVVARMEITDAGIEELAQSISEVGLIQSVLLRPVGDRFEMIAGHRRLLAHKLLSVDKIRSVVRVMTDQEAAIARAAENLAREDLTPLEEAITYKELLDNQGMSFEEIARKFGYSPGTVKRRMDLLKMPDPLQILVHQKRISISVAEELWPISDPVELDYYLTFAVENGVTKDVARAWCKEWRDKKRREGVDGEGGGQVRSPQEPRPVYVPCDLCNGSMLMGDETVYRCCHTCVDLIKKS